jgi:DNA-directed RNA polymerase specialized sigma24 family protein
MFNEVPEYSSDVEWLLQDKQAKVNHILQLMVPEHFERTFRMAFLISMDPEAAKMATRETFANALLSRHRYSSDQEVQEWLDQILITTCQEYLSWGNHSGIEANQDRKEQTAPGWKPADGIDMQVWRTLESLPFSDRLPFLICSIFLYPVPKVARLLGLREGAADARLEATRLHLLTGLNGKASADLSFNEEKIQSCLSRSFQERWEIECAVPQEMESTISAIQTLVDQKRHERRRRALIQEILLVAIVIVLVITLVQVAFSLSAEPNAFQISPTLHSYLSITGI